MASMDIGWRDMLGYRSEGPSPRPRTVNDGMCSTNGRRDIGGKQATRAWVGLLKVGQWLIVTAGQVVLVSKEQAYVLEAGSNRVG